MGRLKIGTVAVGVALVVSAAAGAQRAVAPRELTADEQVAQALSRLTYGAAPGDAERVRRMGVDAWIASQLDGDASRDTAAAHVVSAFPALSLAPGELMARFRDLMRARKAAGGADTAAMKAALRDDPSLAAAARELRAAAQQVPSAAVARAVVSERQLDEVMVGFWENHFSVYSGKGPTRFLLASYDRDAIRPYALGKFRDLLGAVAHSPAMLFYLDNWQSAADSLHPTLARGFRRGGGAARRPSGLNENYARELMELHTLGVDGGYTQQDVIEVARALTGWSIDQRTGGFAFRPALHDAGEKHVLGHTLAAGRGEADGEEVLDILARSPATAHHIALQLVQHFVADSAPPALVDRAAATYLRTDGDIREVMRTIVTSPEFFSRAAWRAKVKTPFELVVSTLRALGAPADTTPVSAMVIARLGQPVFGRQTPDGWPDRGDAWMNTGAILNRINFGLAVSRGRLPGVSVNRWVYADSLAGLSREAQVDGIVRVLLAGEASRQTRAVLLNGRNPLAAEDDATDTAMGDTALARLVGLALGSPEFQRR